MSSNVDPRARAAGVIVEISVGELLDKISILKIKRARISDPTASANVEAELTALEQARSSALDMPSELRGEFDEAVAELGAVNARLWDIEDEIRVHERDRTFDARFIELARSVYFQNDRRGALKRRINVLAGSRLVEEKLYAGYE